MKYAFVLATMTALAATPALAGGKAGSLIGGVITPVTTAVSGVKVNALNNVSVLNGVGSGNVVASGNKAGLTAIVSRNGILGGLLGSRGHGCGCN
ncbi:MAG: hypothetical protein BGP06_03095 [Rhizobiales bacterium 65-9]|nr:hypothetical protein [Hyphomicrobiales bacterium]OJY35845.1 MAG: hypothetical protein BGP06_03095 [Rhizobiales bacterium 65-9]